MPSPRWTDIGKLWLIVKLTCARNIGKFFLALSVSLNFMEATWWTDLPCSWCSGCWSWMHPGTDSTLAQFLSFNQEGLFAISSRNVIGRQVKSWCDSTLIHFLWYQLQIWISSKPRCIAHILGWCSICFISDFWTISADPYVCIVIRPKSLLYEESITLSFHLVIHIRYDRFVSIQMFVELLLTHVDALFFKMLHHCFINPSK